MKQAEGAINCCILNSNLFKFQLHNVALGRIKNATHEK